MYPTRYPQRDVSFPSWMPVWRTTTLNRSACFIILRFSPSFSPHHICTIAAPYCCNCLFSSAVTWLRLGNWSKLLTTVSFFFFFFFQLLVLYRTALWSHTTDTGHSSFSLVNCCTLMSSSSYIDLSSFISQRLPWLTALFVTYSQLTSHKCS